MICAPGLDLCVAEPAFVPQNGAGTDEDIVKYCLKYMLVFPDFG